MLDRKTTREFLERLNENWPEIISPESDIVIALVRLHGLARKKTDQIISDFGLTPAAFEVLVTLRSLPSPRQLTPTELYRSILLSSGGLTKALNALESQQLIKLDSSQKDRRSKTVKLTPKGKKFVEKITKLISDQDISLFTEKMSSSKIQRLRTTLLETLENLESE